MKKIIAMAVAAVCLVSATFALDLEVGAKGSLGRNLDSGTFKENYAHAKEDETFDFGFGAYARIAFVQLEANYVKSSIDFKSKDENGKTKKTVYETHTLDLSPMLWLSADLWKLQVGLGVGPNFAIQVNALGDVKNAKKQDFTVGIIGGTDIKFYFTDHLGLVLSGRYVTDFKKQNVTIQAYGQEVDTGLPEYSFNRKSIYGGLGLEFKLL